MTQAQHGDVSTLADKSCTTHGNLLKRLLPVTYHTCTARVAYAEGSFCLFQLGCVHYVAQFHLIHGGSGDHAGNVSHKCNIKEAMVCSPVGTYQSSAVHAEHHPESLNGHVMNDLIIGALHE